MGDERPDSSRPTTRSSGGARTSADRAADFWKAMKELFGSRWTDQHGEIPSPLWTQAIASMTPAEAKRVLRSLLTSGKAHPPTLPELIEFARPGTAEKSTAKHADPHTADWNAARKTVMDGIAKLSRDRRVEFTDADRDASRTALAIIDNPPGTAGYQAAREENELAAARRMAPLVGMTVDALLAKWRAEASIHRERLNTKTAAHV